MGFFSTIERLKNTPLPADVPCKFVQENFKDQGVSQGSAAFSHPAAVLDSVGATSPPTHRTGTPPAEKKTTATTSADSPEAQTPPADPYTDEPTNPAPPAKRLGENRENFDAAWPWLQANLAALLAAGWTRASLFQRGKRRYPVGRWGIAWLDVWRREGLAVSIGTKGQVVYRFEISNRIVTQTSIHIFNYII